jgi:hypothetical protein
LKPFVLECLKIFSPPTKFSVKENMMAQLNWNYIEDLYFKQLPRKTMITEPVEDHQLFTVDYESGLARLFENAQFNLQLDPTIFEQLWSNEEVNELI